MPKIAKEPAFSFPKVIGILLTMRNLALKLFLGWLLPSMLLAAQPPIIDIHFAVLSDRPEALQRATDAQMRREVDILNTYFIGADGTRPVQFRFKDLVYANQSSATVCAPLVELGDLNKPYDYARLISRYSACMDSRLVDPKAINVYVYDSYSDIYGYGDITCHGIHNNGHPLVLLDWERLDHTTQSPEEHEFGHVFGLKHVCVPGATLNTSTNIMASSDCGLGSGGRRDIGFDANQLSTISQYATTIVAALGPISQSIGSISLMPTSVTIGGTATASAKATSGLAVTFSSVTPSICSVFGSTVTGNAAGICIISASQGGDANYAMATPVNQNVHVTMANLNSFAARFIRLLEVFRTFLTVSTMR